MGVSLVFHGMFVVVMIYNYSQSCWRRIEQKNSLKNLNLSASTGCYHAIRRWIQRGFKVSIETPFKIYFNPDSLNTLIEQSDQDSNKTVASRCSNYSSFIRKEKSSMTFFLFSTQSRLMFLSSWIPFQKSWIRHCYLFVCKMLENEA